jgi:hypothetical protein
VPAKSPLILNTLRWHLFTILEQRPLLFAAMGVNLFNGIFSAWQLADFGVFSAPSLGDALFVVYAGPGLGAVNMVIVSTWLLNQLFFLLLIAKLINEQENTSDYSILLRLASRKRWLWGILASILTCAFFYVSLIIVCALAGIGIVQGWNLRPGSFFQEMGIWERLSELSFMQILGLVWSSLFSSLVAQGLLLVLFMLRIRKIIWGLLALLFISLLAWLLGAGDSIQGWQIWLPSTHSILSRHYPFEMRLPMFTFGFSYLYNAVLGLVLTVAAMMTIKKMDFLGDSHDNQ